MARVVASVVLGLGLVCVPGYARAAAAASDEAAAQALFNEARAEMQKGQFAEACPKLEESYRLVPGAGTKFNLAECYERVGKTASAWAAFRDVAASSKLSNLHERAAAANDRASKLEPKLCRLTIRVADVASGEQPTVTRDGFAVGAAQWGVALPVDPGEHVVEATAKDRLPWKTTVRVASCPAEETIRVPTLRTAVALAKGTAPPPEGAAKAEGKARTRTALTVGSLALSAVGVGLGTYFGVRAWDLRDQSNDAGRCVANRCNDEGTPLRNDSRTAGTVSTIAFAFAGVFLATGAVLWFTRPTTPVTTDAGSSALKTPLLVQF